MLVVGLAHGILYVHVTTDPVELWASPSSRSRIERSYFDSHFEPFYRNEQIIISSIGLPKVSPDRNLALFKTQIEDRYHDGIFSVSCGQTIHRRLANIIVLTIVILSVTEGNNGNAMYKERTLF